MNNSNLPGGWKAVFNSTSKHTYYVDKVTQERTWTKPTSPTASYLAQKNAKANENKEPPSFEMARIKRRLGASIGEKSEKGIELHNEWRRKHGMPTLNEEGNARAAELNAEEKIVFEKEFEAAKARSTKPITKVITNTISTYLKGKFRLHEISDILAALDKQGVNKNTPNYSNYAKQYLELNKILYIIKDKFNKYVDIGRSKEYNGIYIGGFTSTNLLKALYNAELSVSLKDEKYEIPVNDMYNLNWQGINDEEIEKIKDYKKHKHTDFQMINIISRYMGYKQLMDIFLVRFKDEKNASHSENFNMLFPKFLENQARVNAIEENFLAESSYDHILDKIYTVEFSEMLSGVVDSIKEAEETAVKEAKGSIVRSLGPEVRENQNNYFGGRSRRRNRKSTRRNRKSTRRNRRN